MFLSKIWFVLVCLAAGVAMTAAFVAPRSASRQLESSEADGLDRAQYAAEQMLKTDAHRWIDYVAKLGRDATITEALDNATRPGGGEPRMLHETVRNRMQALVPNPGDIGIEQLVAVDAKGRVVARLGGSRDRDYGDSVAGIEVVADSLRGYLSDDVWGTDGKLVRVAAAPVLAKTRDRIVGGVYVAAETGKRLVDIWKKNLGVDVALLLQGQVVSSTLPEANIGTLADLVAERKTEIAEAKRTRAFALPHGSDRLLAVAAPFVGQAAELRAYYVLLGAQTTLSDPLTLLAHTTKEELAWSKFPWLRLVGGILMMILVGVSLQRVEMEGPLARLRAEVQRLARGEIPKLHDARHPGKFGGIARDVNASLERFTHAPAAPATETAGKDLNAILGPDPRSGARTFDLPSLAGLSPSGPAGGFGPQPTPTGPGFGLPSLTSPPTMSPSGSSSMGAIPGARLSSPPLPGPPKPAAMPSGGPPPRPMGAPPPLSFGGTTPTPVVTPPMLASALAANGPLPSSALAMSGSAPRPTPVVPMQASTKLASVPTPVPSAPQGAPIAAEMDDETTTNLAEDPKTAAIDPDEAHMRQVFSDYVQTRTRCGEPTVGLTLEKFRGKLEANKQQLTAKYGCRTARFSVYVKDGKAAIKATPVK